MEELANATSNPSRERPCSPISLEDARGEDRTAARHTEERRTIRLRLSGVKLEILAQWSCACSACLMSVEREKEGGGGAPAPVSVLGIASLGSCVASLFLVT